MANLIKTLAVATTIAVSPIALHSQNVIQKAAKNPTPISSSYKKNSKILGHYASKVPEEKNAKKAPSITEDWTSKLPPPKLDYFETIKKSDFAVQGPQSGEFKGHYCYEREKDITRAEKFRNAIEADVVLPDVVSIGYTPKEWRKGKWTKGYGFKKILDIGAGLGARFSGDSTGNFKIFGKGLAETGALIRAGKYWTSGNPVFKITLVDEFKALFNGFQHKNKELETVRTEGKFSLRNFFGLKSHVNVGDGRFTTSVAGGLLSESGEAVTPAVMGNIRFFVDKKQRFLMFAKGLFAPQKPLQNSFEVGAGARLGK